jgi:hypothetical protein
MRERELERELERERERAKERAKERAIERERERMRCIPWSELKWPASGARETETHRERE